MKKIALLFCTFLLLLACDPDATEFEETAYTPILMQRSDLEKSVVLQDAKTLKNPGKIYAYGDLLFINELFKGIHIYDNTDPENPSAIAYINCPGNLDISIKNGIIYADNAVDLIAMRYANDQLELLHRERNVFPEIVTPDGGGYPEILEPENRPANSVIVRWELK